MPTHCAQGMWRTDRETWFFKRFAVKRFPYHLGKALRREEALPCVAYVKPAFQAGKVVIRQNGETHAKSASSPVSSKDDPRL